MCLADVPLATFLNEPLGPVRDGRGHPADPRHARRGGVRAGRGPHRRAVPRVAAGYETTTAALTALAPGITPEMAAAVSKVMRNQDLVLAASKCRSSRGSATRSACPGGCRCGSSPTTRPTTPRASPPASSTACSTAAATRASASTRPPTTSPSRAALLQLVGDLIARYEIPTQSCVLAPRHDDAHRRSSTARRSTWCSSRSPARRRPTRASAST